MIVAVSIFYESVVILKRGDIDWYDNDSNWCDNDRCELWAGSICVFCGALDHCVDELDKAESLVIANL